MIVNLHRFARHIAGLRGIGHTSQDARSMRFCMFRIANASVICNIFEEGNRS
jgi:hypothetical protein